MNNLSKTNFTELEKQLLRCYLPKQNVEFIPEGMKTIHEICALIFDCEEVFLHPNIIKGVVGSLVKKDILMSEDMEDRGVDYIYLRGGRFDENQELLDELINIVK